jgi:hypothetical protein
LARPVLQRQVELALFAALIHEIRIIDDDTVQPVFQLPLGRNNERPSTD